MKSFERIPKTGSIYVKVYAPRERTKRGRQFFSAELRYKFDGRWHRPEFWGATAQEALARAREAARKKAEELSKGAPATALHPADQAACVRFILTVREVGKPIDQLGFEVAEAHKLAPGVSLIELARGWAERQQAGTRTGRVFDQAFLEEFIAAKKKKKLIGARHERNLRYVLGWFRDAFPRPLETVSALQVERGLEALGKEREFSNRTLNNFLCEVQNLYNWACQNRFIGAELNRDVQAIDAWQELEAEQELFSPAELKRLLETALRPYSVEVKHPKTGAISKRWHSDRELVPYLVIAAFGKVRNAEAAERLCWEDIDADDVVVKKRKAKTRRTRRIQLTKNLRAWLREPILDPMTGERKVFAKLSGRICPYANVNNALGRLARRAGVKWRRNGLRKSASTYHMILSGGDANLVSSEAGNSPAVLQGRYLEEKAARKADAEAWFAIYPPREQETVLLQGVMFGG